MGQDADDTTGGGHRNEAISVMEGSEDIEGEGGKAWITICLS
jgi:hypothetical protein